MEPFIGIIFYLTVMLAPQDATSVTVQSEHLSFLFTLQKGGAWKVESLKPAKIGGASIEKGLFGIWTANAEEGALEAGGKRTTQKISTLLEIPDQINWKTITEIPVSAKLVPTNPAKIAMKRTGPNSIIFYRDKQNVLPEKISIKYDSRGYRK